MHLRIDPHGQVHGLYSEELDLSTLGPVTIRRASHVEADDQGRWWADLSPVAGPLLGAFPSRSQALAAEVQWLEAHWLNGPAPSAVPVNPPAVRGDVRHVHPERSHPG